MSTAKDCESATKKKSMGKILGWRGNLEKKKINGEMRGWMSQYQNSIPTM